MLGNINNYTTATSLNIKVKNRNMYIPLQLQTIIIILLKSLKIFLQQSFHLPAANCLLN